MSITNSYRFFQYPEVQYSSHMLPRISRRINQGLLVQFDKIWHTYTCVSFSYCSTLFCEMGGGGILPAVLYHHWTYMGRQQTVESACFLKPNLFKRLKFDHKLIVCLQERFVKRRQHLVGPNSSTLKVFYFDC